METRKCKVSVTKPGGNASENAKKYRLNLPSKWVQEMGLTADDRDLVISFDGTSIVVRKAGKEEQ